MKYIKILFIAIFCNLIASLNLFCQVSATNLKMLSDSLKGITPHEKLELMTMIEFNIDSTKKVSADESKKRGILVFGYEYNVNININNSGTVDTLPDGSILWRLRVKSEKAYSLNFIFTNFHLSQGSRLFIYNSDRSVVLGAYTEKNNFINNKFSTELIQGDEVTFEYFEPKNVIGEGRFNISKIVHGFLDVINSPIFKNSEFDNILNWTDCSKNVNCTEGEEWCREKRATVRILYSTILWSGVLLNYTSGSPVTSGSLVLTAYHGIDLNDDFIISQAEKNEIENYIFYFSYMNQTCSHSSSISNYHTFNGASFRSAFINTDFALIELNNSFTISDNVFYAGWSYTSPVNEPEPKVTCLHFPGQNAVGMQISFDDDEANTDYAPEHADLGQVYWKMSAENGVNYFDDGSSGSPYFNEEHKVIAQHRSHSINSPCNVEYEWGGKFSESWVGGGTDETSLHHWLAPNWTSGDLSVDGVGFPVYIYGRNHDLDITTITPLCDPANQDEFCVTYFNIDDLYIGGGCHNNYILPFFASIFEDDSIDVRNNTYTVPQYPLNLNLRSATKIIIKPTTKINWGVNFSAKITCDNAPISASDDHNIYQRGCSAHDSCVWNSNNRINPSQSESEKRVSTNSVPLLTSLFQNIPNPFSSTTDISYVIGEAGYARIAVYNSLGQQVAELVNTAEHKAGKFNIKFEHSGLESGVYFYTLTCNNFVDVKKMMLIK